MIQCYQAQHKLHQTSKNLAYCLAINAIRFMRTRIERQLDIGPPNHKIEDRTFQLDRRIESTEGICAQHYNHPSAVRVNVFASLIFKLNIGDVSKNEVTQ